MRLKILLLSFLAVFLLGGSASAYTIWDNSDNYWGADPSGDYANRDVIGNGFAIDHMEVDINSYLLTVDIYTDYVNNLGKLGTELGDLFISTNGWNPNTAGNHYEYDNYLSTPHTTWEYAIVLDNHNPANNPSAGTAYLYTVDENRIRLSDDFFGSTGYTYREGQEVRYYDLLPLVDGGEERIQNEGEGTWSIDADSLTFMINLPQDVDWSNLAFHWAMTCANDVIEGPAPVPEPATMFLLGSGLIGLAAIGRKKFRKNNNS